jgi:GxxExxY protein
MLGYELNHANIPFKLQVALPVHYKQIRLDCGYRIDLLVDDRLLVELKSVDQLLMIHEAQVLTYMKLSGVRVGLLIDFNVEVGAKKRIEKIRSLNLRVLRALRGENPIFPSRLRHGCNLSIHNTSMVRWKEKQ